MRLKRSIASAFALIAAASATGAAADEDFIRDHSRGPHTAPAPSGYQQVIEPTIVPACSRDGWLIETSYEILAHEELLRLSGGIGQFGRRYRNGLDFSLKELIRDAVENRTGSRALLFPPREEAMQGGSRGGITSDLAQGVEKLLAPIEKEGKARLIARLSTVRAQPYACTPR
jgi:hypothetical protein